MVIYTYIYIFMFTVEWAEIEHHYILAPRGVHHHKSRPWGLSWTCDICPMGGIP
jgi:hypothetical protein